MDRSVIHLVGGWVGQQVGMLISQSVSDCVSR